MGNWKREFDLYVLEVMNAGVNVVGIMHEVRELCLVLLEEGIYIDRIWFSVSGYPEKILRAYCYDEDGYEFEMEAIWRYRYTSCPQLERVYELLEVAEID